MIWTKEDVSLLKVLWVNYTPKEINREHFPEATLKSLHSRCRNIKRSEECNERIKLEIKNMLTKRNRRMGRHMNYSFAKEEVKKYQSRQEMYAMDNSLYQFVRNNNYMEELCSHMVFGASFNYPQRFMYNCIKQLAGDCEIRYNDRKAVRPLELDIYIPSMRIGIEYNGVRFHSTEEAKQRDLLKKEKCAAKEITLYSLAESCKRKPEEGIIEFLGVVGFDISFLDKEKAKKDTFNEVYSKNLIEKTVAKYTSYKEFREQEQKLYGFLLRNNLIGEYTSDLIKRANKQLSDKEIVGIIGECGSGKMFREKYHAYFLRVYKNKEMYPESWSKYLTVKERTTR